MFIAPYVKVYLLDGKTCLEKQRTRTTRRTLDPLIQQTLNFKEYFRGKVLQVIHQKEKHFFIKWFSLFLSFVQISVWGDYGKLDRKVFMGVCQLGLDEVNLSSSQQVLDWYKLFSANSLLNNYTIVQQSPRRIHSTSTINRSWCIYFCLSLYIFFFFFSCFQYHSIVKILLAVNKWTHVFNNLYVHEHIYVNI